MHPPIPRVFFHSTLDSPDDWKRALAPHLDAFEFVVGPACTDLASIDVALLYKPPPQGFASFTRLRAVISLSAGINQFADALAGTGVPLARSIDTTLTQQMVAYARAAVYRYHRRFHLYEADTRARLWRFEAPKACHETTVGVLGLGEIGACVAGALAADGFRVLGWSRSSRQLRGIETHAGTDGLRQLVAGTDILINVLPLTTETQGILDAGLFQHARPGACLVNMGRGGHLVEADLVSALADGRISAATLDVTQVEPLPQDSPLWAHPQVLITPHIAGITSALSAAPQVAQNIHLAMQGARLCNQVDFMRGY